MLFNCPAPAALAAIPATTCAVKWDQIQKMALGRKSATARFDAVTNLITAQATWTALLAEVDDQKIVITPYFSGFSIPSNEVIAQGGNDNTTINGVREVQGLGMVTVSLMFKNISAATAEALRAIGSETMIQPGETNIEAYFFNNHNQIIHDGGADGTGLLGFDIYNLVVPDLGAEGLNTNNSYAVTFDLAPAWSRYFKVVDADFNPRSL